MEDLTYRQFLHVSQTYTVYLKKTTNCHMCICKPQVNLFNVLHHCNDVSTQEFVEMLERIGCPTCFIATTIEISMHGSGNEQSRPRLLSHIYCTTHLKSILITIMENGESLCSCTENSTARDFGFYILYSVLCWWITSFPKLRQNDMSKLFKETQTLVNCFCRYVVLSAASLAGVIPCKIIPKLCATQNGLNEHSWNPGKWQKVARYLDKRVHETV